MDDDPLVLDGIRKDIEREGFKVTTSGSGEDAIELICVTAYGLVITDLVMEGVNGIQVLKKTKELHPETMVIILTGLCPWLADDL